MHYIRNSKLEIHLEDFIDLDEKRNLHQNKSSLKVSGIQRLGAMQCSRHDEIYDTVAS